MTKTHTFLELLVQFISKYDSQISHGTIDIDNRALALEGYTTAIVAGPWI